MSVEDDFVHRALRQTLHILHEDILSIYGTTAVNGVEGREHYVECRQPDNHPFSERGETESFYLCMSDIEDAFLNAVRFGADYTLHENAAVFAYYLDTRKKRLELFHRDVAESPATAHLADQLNTDIGVTAEGVRRLAHYLEPRVKQGSVDVEKFVKDRFGFRAEYGEEGV